MTSTAAIYTRISLDEQDGAGVARQEVDCRDLAEREGLTVAGVYCDNSISAYSGAPRPAFERLLEDVRAGHVDTVLVWATDRLYRRMGDLLRIIEALRDVPVVAVKSGRIDLSTADGRAYAKIVGTIAEQSSEKTAERVAAAARQRALSGRSTTGSRPFGWARDGAGNLTPDPIEGPAVADAYRMLLEGRNLSQIARDLTAQGFTGSKGGPITQARVSAILRHPRHAGLVQYRGQLVDEVESAEGRIVDVDTWRQAQRILTTPGRKTKGRPAHALLAGFLTCYKCKGPVRASSNQSRAGVRYKTYACASNHVSWRREELDELVAGKVERWLVANIDTLRRAAAETPAKDSARLEAEADRLRDDRAALADALSAGALTVTAYAAAVGSVEARLAEVEAQLVPVLPAASRAILGASDVAAAWRAGDLAARRAVLAEAVGTTITVHPKRSGLVEIGWKR